MATSLSGDWEKLLLPSIKARVRTIMDREIQMVLAEVETKLRKELVDEALETAITISRYIDKKGDDRITVDVRFPDSKGGA